MTVGWPAHTLEDLCELVTDGSHFSPNTQSTGRPYVTVRDVDGGVIDLIGCKRIADPAFQELERNGCRPLRGDVLFSKDGTVGKVAIVDTDEPFVVLSSLAILRPKKSLISPRYLAYALENPAFLNEAIDRKTGAAIRRIILKNLKSMRVPVPPLVLQERIVAILDEAFKGIRIAAANAGKSLVLADLLFIRELELIFDHLEATAPRKTLAEVALEFGRGKSKHRPRGDPRLYGGPYPFIQTGDVSGCDHLIEKYDQTYNEMGLAQSRLWPAGTVCISIVGAKIAETGLLTFSACFPDSVIGFVPDESQAESGYVEYMLQSFRLELRAKGKGTARHNINLATFESERFPFPDLHIQRTIRAKLDEVRLTRLRVGALVRQKADRFDELRQSILSRAFSGQLSASKGLAA